MNANVLHIMRSGVPTAPDVDRLMQLDMKPGTEIGFGQVETVLRIRRDENRFRTVTNAWRKRLFRERGLRVIVQRGTFVALTPEQALSASVSGLTRVRRAAVRETAYVSAIDSRQLSAHDQERHMLLRRHASALAGHAQDACRAIAPPKPVGAIAAKPQTA